MLTVEPRLSQFGSQVSPAASATAGPISGINPGGTPVLAAMTCKTCEGRLLPTPIGSLGMPSLGAEPVEQVLLRLAPVEAVLAQSTPRNVVDLGADAARVDVHAMNATVSQGSPPVFFGREQRVTGGPFVGTNEASR